MKPEAQSTTNTPGAAAITNRSSIRGASWGGLAAKERSLSGSLFHQIEHVACAGHALRPGVIEILHQPPKAFRLQRRFEPRHVGKLIRRVVHASLRRAPESPALVAPEFLERQRQMMARIPLIELLPQGLGD